MLSEALFSNNTDNWKTPSDIYNYFINDLNCVDPCPFMSEQDNLYNTYEFKNIYINPPYSKIKEWVSFIKRNVAKNIIYLLIPARTDTEYFHELMDLNNKGVNITLYFIKGRLHFNDSPNSAPFPSVLIKFDATGLTFDIITHFISKDQIKIYTEEVNKIAKIKTLHASKEMS